MPRLTALFLLSCALTAAANPAEHLGTVSFSNSCAAYVQPAMNRGIALLHDFWYEEAKSQFQQIAQADPGCSIAHWGAAMSFYHQIWDRPADATIARAYTEIQKAQEPPAKTAREREYIAAAALFFQPGKLDYQARVDGYSSAMAALYQRYPGDTDAAAFYALSLLAAKAPGDASVAQERKALAVLTPLDVKYPDHPGLVHYIIHACDNPTLAPQGLAAARHYGEIAPTAPHAAHMPGHIFARLGMWQPDIDSNLASVAASHAAELKHQSGAFDQFHAFDFLMYAYLQSAQDAHAREVFDKSFALLTEFETMPDMSTHGMANMLPYYRGKLPVFYSLERRDWQAASALEPVAGSYPDLQLVTYWAHAVAAGHLHQAAQAQASLKAFEAATEQLKGGKYAYVAGSTGTRIRHSEIAAWTAFAESKPELALTKMREAADLQDKVGQGEVDIPAREMLADMLLDLHQPGPALIEYEQALKLSPNRFNGLYHAGLAAETLGDKAKAETYYATLLKSTNNGAASTRPEFDHIRKFRGSSSVPSTK